MVVAIRKEILFFSCEFYFSISSIEDCDCFYIIPANMKFFTTGLFSNNFFIC